MADMTVILFWDHAEVTPKYGSLNTIIIGDNDMPIVLPLNQSFLPNDKTYLVHFPLCEFWTDDKFWAVLNG